jgi:uncharacterized membrane protein
MPFNLVQEHVELIAKHEQDFLARRTRTERISDTVASFTGSLIFVLIHVAILATWIVVNTCAVPHIRHFDPAPFSLLGTFLTFEAILLASFILMRQTRMSRRADERDHLMLQILLLSEKEITAVLGMNRQIAGSVGLDDVTRDKGLEHLSQSTSIDEMAQSIHENLPSE